MKYLLALLIYTLPIAAQAQSPVSVRVKNNSKLAIKKIELTNSHGEEYTFSNIKAGKTSAYQKFESMCSCSYQMKIWYIGKDAVNNNCTNIIECKDFFKGKILIKLDGKFKGKNANAELTFKQE